MSTKTAIAVFVKTPGLLPLKTRLARTIGVQASLEFYCLSLEALAETLQSMNVNPHWAVAEQEGLTNPLWQNFPNLWTGEGDLGQRQCHVYHELLQNHDKVILIGADAPQLSQELLKQTIASLDNYDFVIGPAHDGGYYLFGGKAKTLPHTWSNIQWSAETTRSELENKLPSPAFHLLPLTDVDEKKHLFDVVKQMPENKNETQKTLVNWIKAL